MICCAGDNGVERQHGARVGRQDLRLPDLLPAAAGAGRLREGRPGCAPEPPERGPHHSVHALPHSLCHDSAGPGKLAAPLT